MLLISNVLDTKGEGVLYKLLFSRGFYFREFRESDPRENF